MKKFKIFFRFDKEEKWLEQMAAQGWLLFKKSFFYYFQEITPEEKTIRADYRMFNSNQDFSNYCCLFEDSGWRHIAGTKSSGTQYFLKDSPESSNDIFSDEFSKAGRYKRLSGMWLYFAVCFIPIFFGASTGGWGEYILQTPKEWYLTPGLWDLEGYQFWFSFLFETPFALLRGLAWIIPAVCFLFYAGMALKSWLLYRAAAAGSPQAKTDGHNQDIRTL